MKKILTFFILYLILIGTVSAKDAYFVCQNTDDINEREFVLIINKDEKVLFRANSKYKLKWENKTEIGARQENEFYLSEFIFNKYTGNATLFVFDKKRDNAPKSVNRFVCKKKDSLL